MSERRRLRATRGATVRWLRLAITVGWPDRPWSVDEIEALGTR